MKRFFIPLLLVTLLLVLTGLFLGHLSPHAVAASPRQTHGISPSTCNRTWSVVGSPSDSRGSSSLQSIAAISSTDVWAVGNVYIMFSSSALVQHWNGTAWSIVTDASSATGRLEAVAAISSNDVWAVGTNSNLAFTEHWNGGAWTAVASPSPTGVSGLSAVAAVSTNDVWAVGASTDASNNQHTLIEHWNGSQWSIVPGPNIASASNTLTSVTALSATNVWAVGSAQVSQSVGQTLIEHWNGYKWKIVSSPSVAGQTNYLYSAVAVAAKDVWAVGASVNSFFQSQAYFLHWNGTAWSIVSIPNASQVSLRGMVAISAKNVWAVGSLNESSGFVNTFIEHWNGTVWSVVSSPNAPGTNTDNLLGISRVPGTAHLWAVGNSAAGPSDTQTLTEFFC